MQSLKALAQSTLPTLGEIKDALVGDDEDEEDVGQRSIFETTRALTPGPVDDSICSLPKAGEESAKCSNPASLSEDSEPDPCQHENHEALKEFAALRQLPALEETLESLGIQAAPFSHSADTSVPRVAILCCRVLRQALPKVALEERAPSEAKRLLVSFNERYEQVLEEHMALQRKCRDLTSRNVKCEALAQQAEAWQSAHQAAIARIEELSSENAELKEQMLLQKRQGMDPKERMQLQQLLSQKDAELQASADAMCQLEEIMEEQNLLSDRNASLERQIRALRQAQESQEPREPAKPSPVSHVTSSEHLDLSARCRAAEAELKETSAALEILLEEKSRRLEDQEFLVDRRLVASMLALYHEHKASGQQALAGQVLTTALSILGGVPQEAQTSRASVKAAAAAAEARLAEPLGNAFVDFLEKEATVSEVQRSPVEARKDGAPG